MANVNMANITLYEATPQVDVPNYKLQGGRVYSIVDTIALETGDIASSDTITFARLPVDAILLSVLIANDDLGTTLTVELGFARTIADGGAALDADILHDGIAFGTAAGLTEYRFSVLDINTAQQPVWDIAGVSARPSYEFIDIRGNVTASSTPAAGDVSIQVKYTM